MRYIISSFSRVQSLISDISNSPIFGAHLLSYNPHYGDYLWNIELLLVVAVGEEALLGRQVLLTHLRLWVAAHRCNHFRRRIIGVVSFRRPTQKPQNVAAVSQV